MASVEKTTGPGGLETWLADDGRARVELIPARGGLVSRYRVGEIDVLYLDEATVATPGANVRGGVPQLFPFAGRPPAGSSLPQHGFARRLPWAMVDATADGHAARLSCELAATDETRAAFPFDFVLRMTATVEDGHLVLEWKLTNRGPERMPVHFGIHPYFVAPQAVRPAARLGHGATRAFDNLTKAEGPAPRLDLSRDNDCHLLDHPLSTIELERGDGRTVRLAWTPHFTVVVVWTPAGKDFMCVEPWTAPGGALEGAAGLFHLAPRASVSWAVDLTAG